MFKFFGKLLLEGLRFVIGSIAMVIAAIWVRFFSKADGPYAVVPVLLAPMIALQFLHLWDEDREF